MANASLEDCQLFAQSEILQRDLFIAAKDQEDHPKKREDCVQHEAESVSASSLKINRSETDGILARHRYVHPTPERLETAFSNLDTYNQERRSAPRQNTRKKMARGR